MGEQEKSSVVAPEVRVSIPASEERYRAMTALSEAMAEVARTIAVLARDGQPNVVVTGCVVTNAGHTGIQVTNVTYPQGPPNAD